MKNSNETPEGVKQKQDGLYLSGGHWLYIQDGVAYWDINDCPQLLVITCGMPITCVTDEKTRKRKFFIRSQDLIDANWCEAEIREACAAMGVKP